MWWRHLVVTSWLVSLPPKTLNAYEPANKLTSVPMRNSNRHTTSSLPDETHTADQTERVGN
jgi:hypothetical protein